MTKIAHDFELDIITLKKLDYKLMDDKDGWEIFGTLSTSFEGTYKSWNRQTEQQEIKTTNLKYYFDGIISFQDNEFEFIRFGITNHDSSSLQVGMVAKYIRDHFREIICECIKQNPPIPCQCKL
jgi:hypothetical protein